MAETAFLLSPQARCFTRHGKLHCKNYGRSIRRTARQTLAVMGKSLDITSVGNLCIDIILPIISHPVRQGEHQSLTTGARMEVGGSMNALISAHRLGARAAHIAYISPQDDETAPSDRLFSAFASETALRIGLDTSAMIPRRGSVIPTCAALTDAQGGHTFLASNELPEDGASNAGERAAADEMLSATKCSKVHIVDGYALHSDRDLVRATVEVAGASGTEIWVDPQAATRSLVEGKDTLFTEILARADGVALTLAEAAVLSGETESFAAMRAIAKERCPRARTMVVKMGADGCCVGARGEGEWKFWTVEGYDVRVRDCVGAGDAFLGGFLAGRVVHGLGVREAAEVGNAMGAATCERAGAGEVGVGSRRDVVRFLRGTGLEKRFGGMAEGMGGRGKVGTM